MDRRAAVEKRIASRFIPAIVLSSGIALAIPAAHADVVFAVDTILDQVDADTGDGQCRTSANRCSLRAAVMQANHVGDPGLTIIQLPAGIYALTLAPSGMNGEDEGDLNLVTPATGGQTLSIIGAGAASTIIDGNHLDRVLAIDVGCTARISGVTIRNGTRTGNSFGGGIANRGSLAIADSVIEGNRADQGGGIDNSGVLDMLRCTVRSNTAQYGGGMYVYGDTRLRDSTLEGNAASPGSGGAIFNANQLRVVNSTLSRNAADTDGGAIYNNYKAYVYSSSIVNNDADHDRDENGGSGGGVHAAAFTGAQFLIINVLFAYNTVLDAPIYNDCAGTLDAVGWNLFGEPSGCSINGPWGLVTPATIGPLQNHGGPTRTHALLAGSEAVDPPSGSSSCVDDEGEDMPTDQRGAARVSGAGCDIGAFESGSVVDLVFTDGFD
jgi:hypothetical protein